jgi:translation initiation factor IF-3
MAHPEQGRMVLDRLAEDLRPYATIEQPPKMEGRNMHMLVAPIKGAFDRQPEGDAE